jgi:hypothetical protein
VTAAAGGAVSVRRHESYLRMLELAEEMSSRIRR